MSLTAAEVLAMGGTLIALLLWLRAQWQLDRISALLRKETSRYPMFAAPVTTENFTAAAQCFAAESEMDIAEERLMNALDAILGDCTTGGWDDYKFDRSDESLEVYGVRQGTVPVEELAALGFRRVWLHPMRHSQNLFGGCGAGECRCEAITFPSKEPTR